MVLELQLRQRYTAAVHASLMSDLGCPTGLFILVLLDRTHLFLKTNANVYDLLAPAGNVYIQNILFHVSHI